RGLAELSVETAAPLASAPAVPPLSVAHGGAGQPSTAGGPHAVLDASNAKPGVGQPVDFVARFIGAARPKVEGARFRIVGPGIASGTEVAAIDDGSGTFRTTFTFLEGGRFDVTFNARADGTPVHAARIVQVAPAAGATVEPHEAPPAAPTAVAPPAPPGDTSKWL
ncbi:MAG TPA: hypothetical protein VKU41_16880, partial [Polyangiaceae bacterium]|nr:hypothetical protein [Polyangiaceae bacterium]